MPLAVGTKVGPYEIVDMLGGGGMGEVYRARDVRLGRIVALKIIGAARGTPADMQRFELEARATSAINHPHIVALYDVGEYGGAPYLVTELLQGETLRSRLVRGPIPAAKAIEYARQIASGLAAAHDHGIVHRDLKPENVFITSEGHVKILDFGLAKVKVAAGPDAMTEQAAFGLTSAGSIVGTVSYMSPEQVRGGDIDHRSDMFSFGAVLYEMLTGRPAFREKSAVETMHAILNKEPEPIDAVSGAVPPPVAFIVRQCLEKNPRERFQSARDLELHFGAMSGGQVSMQGTALAASGRSRRWWLAPAAAGAAVSLLVAAGAWGLVGRRGGTIVIPDYRQLTYRRGFINAARFTSDGHTIVYSASWDGAPAQAFSMRLENPESRPLDLKAASLLAVSSTGEVAVSLNGQHLPRLLTIGTLARVPIMGGIPREVMKDVVQADWSPDGATFAVIRMVEGKYRLEYPAGKVLYENSGGLADVRISRDGTTVAFTEHPALPDDRGDICLVGPDGVKRVVSAGWASVSGLAWSPRGDEIWFTASEIGASTSLWAMKPGGTRRLLIKSLGRKTVLDVTPDGQVLLSEGRLRFMMAYRDAPQAPDRLLSWLDASFAADISSDGATLIFDEQGEGSRQGYSTYLRKSDGSAAIRLGDGYAGSLSPDMQRVAALTLASPPSVTILPTGAGESATIARGPIAAYTAVTWTPDSQSVVFAGREQGHGTRVYRQNIKDGTPRPVSPEGFSFRPYTAPLSPDGGTIIAAGTAGQLVKISLSDGTVHPLEGSQPGDRAMRWAADGRTVFVARITDRPASIWRVAVEGGRRELMLTLAPTDQAGYTSVGTAQITPDGRHLAYSFGQNLMDLYLVRGLQ